MICLDEIKKRIQPILEKFGIALSRVWITIEQDLPELKVNIQAIKESQS